MLFELVCVLQAAVQGAHAFIFWYDSVVPLLFCCCGGSVLSAVSFVALHASPMTFS